MIFDWDDANILHLARHAITPDEAEQAIRNGTAILGSDDSSGEPRFTETGETDSGRILTLITVDRSAGLRIVTGWDATRDESITYFREVARRR